MLQNLTKVNGLTSIVSGTAWSTGGIPEFKVGAEFNNSNTKAKALANIRSLNTLITLSHLYKRYNFGSSLNIDLKSQTIVKNEFGVTWSPADGSRVGIHHVAEDNKPAQLGKFWFYFNHAATSAQTVGTVFGYDWNKKEVSARLAVANKFNDSTNGKFKVDQDGKVDAVLKHQYNSTVSASFVTSFNLKTVVETQKTKALPVGLAFDFKF